MKIIYVLSIILDDCRSYAFSTYEKAIDKFLNILYQEIEKAPDRDNLKHTITLIEEKMDMNYSDYVKSLPIDLFNEYFGDDVAFVNKAQFIE